MTKFNHVIIRRPGKSLCDGITSAPELGQPIYERAIEEHYDYEHALEQCGVDVTVLPALEQFPDSCFVEDPAVITRCGAIITNPGAASRNGEKDEIEPVVRRFFDDEHVKHIVSPGTLDGVNYIEDNNMLVSGEFIDKPDFAKYNKVVVPEDEAYGANCIWVSGTVIVAEGYPTVLKAVQDLGYKTLVVDTSEYRKIDGGLSCLSLRF